MDYIIETMHGHMMQHTAKWLLRGTNCDILSSNGTIQTDPSYRPSLVPKNSFGSAAPPFAGSDLVLSPSQWSSHVVGMCCQSFLLCVDVF